MYIIHKYFEALNINIFCINCRRLSIFYSAKRVLLELLQKLQPNIVHSQGIRADYINRTLDGLGVARVSTQRNDPTIDLVIHGHTHRYVNTIKNGVRVINPGESAGILKGKNSVGLLRLKDLSFERIFF